MPTAIQNKTLYYGDCLEWMRKFPDECVDLIYLDPPFNSDANYNIIFGESNGTPAQVRAFTDTWKWNAEAVARVREISNAVANPANRAIKGLFEALGKSGMMSYLSYMAERLIEMNRLLKPTGSIYLHCDPTASHYIKVLMDVIFGSKNFRNEIVWYYTNKIPDKRKKLFTKSTDTILFYAKDSDSLYFDVQEEKRDKPQKVTKIKKVDGKKIYVRGDDGKVITYTRDVRVVDNVWIIPLLHSQQEYLGYPTQKPLALLERIVKASSKEGDFVLDPFCGCGTTVAAAHNLNRNWAGIDISSFAIDVINERRLAPQGITPNFAGIPYDLTSARKLAKQKPLDFETWAIQRVSGLAPNQKQVKDGGIDGRGTFDPLGKYGTDDSISKKVVAQVKGGKFSLSQLRDFLNVVEQDNFGFGIYITLDKVSSSDAKTRVAEFGKIKIASRQYPRVQLWSIEDYFDGVIPDLPPLLDPYTGKRQAQDVQFDEEEETDEPQNGRFNGM